MLVIIISTDSDRKERLKCIRDNHVNNGVVTRIAVDTYNVTGTETAHSK